ncbi:MAG: peptidoglycan DD-metalloendopeptidase family protein [Peptostreptococcaceae bacterium]|nr:peptidoglycan DD-metalloendopeptidase family protein [Peptostreptococcaceae bacterium]
MKKVMNLKAKFDNISGKIKSLDRKKRNIIAISMISVLLLGAIGVGASVISSADSKEITPKVAPISAYSIMVDGKEIVKVSSENDAEIVLNQVKNNYITAGAQVKEVDFAEEVTVTNSAINVNEEEILTTQEAITLILTGSKEPKTYVVQGGDTVWDVAALNNLSSFELMDMNPGVSDEISIGQTLNLYQIKPYLTVKTTEVVVATEKIEYGIKYEYTTNLYKGQSQVKSAGNYGSKIVTAEVVKENGIVVQSTPISEEIAAEPLTQISFVGTKTIPIATGTGQLGVPVTHIEISSAYGSRGGGRHEGVDLRQPRGSAIMAADDGTVTKASYSGSYGNLIIINHGNGIQTYYGHCDSMNVSVGEQVTKGQVIGTVGATGNATGNHLHFEVRINGVSVNPFNYM